MFQHRTARARAPISLFRIAPALLFVVAALAQDEAAQRWLDRFSFKQPPVSEEGNR